MREVTDRIQKDGARVEEPVSLIHLEEAAAADGRSFDDLMGTELLLFLNRFR